MINTNSITLCSSSFPSHLEIQLLQLVSYFVFKALANGSVWFDYNLLIIVIAEISEQSSITKNRSRSDAGCKQSPHYHINQPGGRTLPDLTLRCLQCKWVEQKQLCNQRLLVELTFNLTFKQSGKTPANLFTTSTILWPLLVDFTDRKIVKEFDCSGRLFGPLFL